MSFNYNNLFILFAIFYLSCELPLPPEGCEFGKIECPDGSCAAYEANCPDDTDDPSPETGDIIITSPNGYNNFATGYSQPITWSASSSITKVKIYYTKNNGTAVTIDDNETNDGTYTWSIPSSLATGTNYKIKICDYYNSTVCDESNYNFSIISGGEESSTLMVTSPNGDEQWAPGSSQPITWGENISDSYVSIKLYKNGSLKTAIKSSATNNGKYIWSIPSTQTTGTDYTVKICGTSSTTTCDESEYDFSIVDGGSSGDPITVTSPNGGEQWSANSSQAITWSENISDANVSIKLYKDGAFDSNIDTSDINDGSYTWSIPSTQTTGTDYTVKICGTSSTTTCDESDYNFSIVGPILVTSPNGDEQWATNSSQTITWSASSSITKVKIYYTKNNGTAVTIDDNETNDGTYTWSIPSSLATGTNYKIKICDYYNTTTCDESDYNFSIVDPIELTSLNGGENLSIGDSATVTWNENISDTNVSISLNKGGTINTVVKSSTENDGSYTWLLPTTQALGDDYTIKICGTTNTSSCDESANNFSIVTPIIVTYPGGGESLEQNSHITITWETVTSILNVKISYVKGSGSAVIIDSNEQNDGSYSWNIASLATGTDYKIKICNTASGQTSECGESNYNFSVVSSASVDINIVSPNGGEIWGTDAQTITWDEYISDANVSIELYKGGSKVSDISTSTTNDGSHSWSISDAQAPGSDYTIKICGTTNTSSCDESSGTFTIAPIIIISPNGGDNLARGSNHTINWAEYIDNNNVRIYYVKGSGSPVSIDSNESNDGAYTWSIPSSLATGTDYKIKICNTTSGQTTECGESANNFTIY